MDQSLTTFFDLGVSHGTNVTSLNYYFEIVSDPSLVMPVSALTSTSVSPLDYQIGSVGGVDLGSPGHGDRGETSTAEVVKKAVLPDLEKFVNQEQKPNECAPGAISNSLKYLQARGRLPGSVESDIDDIKKIVGEVFRDIKDEDGNVIDKIYIGSPYDWYLKKQKHFEDILETKFIESLAGIDDLIKAIKRGDDVELFIHGHVAVVVGVRVKEDGQIELDIFDDNQKGDGADKMRTVTFVDNKIDGREFQRFVTEKPVPEPTTMLLLGTGLIVFAGLRRKLRMP